MPLYKMEVKPHFTFLQEIYGGIIIIIDKNLFDTYLVDKRTQRKKTGLISGVVSKLRPLAKSNWG